MLSKQLLNEISLPALLLDLDAFDENCQEIAKKANGKTIRIATKSIRSVSLLRRILQSNRIFQGLMSFTPQESIFLSEKGFDDILLGYPCWDMDALIKIAKINQTEKKIILMVDSSEHIDHLQRIALETDGKFYVCIDVDMSTAFANLHFGVRRSPLNNEDAVLQLAKKIKQSTKLEITGMMGYEAQIAGVGDLMPSQFLKNTFISYLKKKSIPEIAVRRTKVIQKLMDEDIPLSLVNGGGTGSLHTTSLEDYVTEVTVGSGFYSPLLFDYYQSFSYKPSLFFALPIVRKPAPNIYTCLGGGYIASGAAGKDKMPKPVYPMGGKLLPLEGAGEVQTPVYYENLSLDIGDAIVFRAAKAGEICERFKEIICISNQQIVYLFNTYRGEGACFL
ncbi:amino acid deaminase/aldolase [Cytobacillus solani]|uniref:Amino acid aldolase n=1 Tax=Cytobacillus solani TaxID=1637975 RepID=A0A0Q3SFB6_9BACI|nr:amino acid deaminase/aldolase [Cytobacillus solani]KOP71139.1 amino acid aldolase [Bacillus sp. FJAT-21945]KQL17916.1 amino acid aldolase [Cytobacillus solani]USK55737.1 amino acid deaminase/aldolase [Cytobacillus solani]